MLPYDGMTRTGSKGVSHCFSIMLPQTPSEGRKVLELCGKGKLQPTPFWAQASALKIRHQWVRATAGVRLWGETAQPQQVNLRVSGRMVELE